MYFAQLSLTTPVPCISNHFFGSIKRWLVDEHIYDKSVKAIPYDSQQIYDFSSVLSLEGAPGPMIPFTAVFHHEYYLNGALVVDKYRVSNVALGTYTAFKSKMQPGVNRFYVVYYSGSSIVTTSNTIRYNCYYIHVFLYLYAMELLNLRKVTVQTRQDLIMSSGATGDNVDPWLHSGVALFDPEWDIVRNVAGYFLLQKYSGDTVSEFCDRIRKVYEATIYAGTKKSIDLFMEAMGVVLQMVPYNSIIFFNLGLSEFTDKFVAGSDFPTVVSGVNYCWGTNYIKFDDRFIMLRKDTWSTDEYGIHYEDEHPNMTLTGTLWIFVNGQICKNSSYPVLGTLKLYAVKNVPPQPDSTVTNVERFSGVTIYTDDRDGTVTGIPGGKYLVLFNRPNSSSFTLNDLQDVDPLTKVDTTKAELIPGTRIVRLNWYQPIPNTLEITYDVDSFNLILAEVIYDSGPIPSP